MYMSADDTNSVSYIQAVRTGYYPSTMILNGRGGAVCIGYTGTIPSGTALTVYNSTASTSTNSGALVVTGGAGIGGNCYVGGQITASNGLVPTSSGGFIFGYDNSYGNEYGNCVFASGATPVNSWNCFANADGGGSPLFAVYNNITGSPMFKINGVYNSTSTSSGAFVVSGGVGIGGSLYPNAIYLPTSGGTATALNYYEEYSVGTTLQGPWGASTIQCTVYLVRIGKIVHLGITSST